jgi:kynurenine aminotransferase
MGQGFFGYNPPKFILDAAKEALDRVDCNQYSPTKGRPRLKQAIADAYAPFWGRKINPDTEVTITTGANEGEFLALTLTADLYEGEKRGRFEGSN